MKNSLSNLDDFLPLFILKNRKVYYYYYYYYYIKN